MKKDLKVYVDDMLDAILSIERYVGTMDEATFSGKDYMQDAVMRQLAIIGEAARQVPEETRAMQPTIPWRKIIDFRNVIIHEYSGVSMGRVWRIIVNDLPYLKDQIVFLRQKV